MNRFVLFFVLSLSSLRVFGGEICSTSLSVVGQEAFCQTARTFDFPGTDIILFDLSSEKGFQLSNPKNISHRKGYDNQPSFDIDGLEILYSADINGQTDIFRYNIAKASSTRLTNTPESEFSPTMMPDKKHISAVLIEKDSTQRLWQFNFNGSEPTLINKKVKDVGYHCWVGSNMYCLFIVGKPYNSLQVSIVGAKTATHIKDNIGRCLQKVPGKSELSFTEINKEGKHIISRMNIYTREITAICPAKGQGQDYTWLPDGSILMAEANKLYRIHPTKSKEWKLVHTFDSNKYSGITRITVDREGKYLAMVVND